MAQYIEVNGEVVEFPDDMSDDEIVQILKQNQQPPQDSISSGFLMGIKDPISGGAQLLPRGLEFITSAGGMAPNPVSQFFGSERERVDAMVKAEEEAYQQSRQAQGETGFDWSRLGGNIASPANLAGLRVLQGAKPVVAALGTGAAQGALQPVYNTEDFGTEKTKQTVAGAAGGVVGLKGTEALGRVANPLVSKAEQTMRELGVQLTPGQLLGTQPKALEEFAQNMPLIGTYISNAKERQLYQFNKGVINKALSKVGTKLPDDVIGRDAVQYTEDVINQQYDQALGKMNFKLDFSTYTGMSKATKIPASPDKRVEVQDILKRTVYDLLPKNGQIDGQAYKKIESDLRKEAVKYVNSANAADKSVGEALFSALDSLKEGLKKQNPKMTPQLRRIDSAYGDIAVMRTAAANSGAVNGVFTPKQYQTAVRQRDATRNKSSFAAGRARGQDISEAAVDTMSPTIGSTLEGRLALGIGGGYGALQAPAVAGSVAVAAPLMYSTPGLKVMEALMTRRPEIARKIGAKLTQRASKEGSITGAEIMEEYNKATRTEK